MKKEHTNTEMSQMSEYTREEISEAVEELKRLGKIMDSGKRRRNADGEEEIVWVATKFVQ